MAENYLHGSLFQKLKQIEKIESLTKFYENALSNLNEYVCLVTCFLFTDRSLISYADSFIILEHFQTLLNNVDSPFSAVRILSKAFTRSEIEPDTLHKVNFFTHNLSLIVKQLEYYQGPKHDVKFRFESTNPKNPFKGSTKIEFHVPRPSTGGSAHTSDSTNHETDSAHNFSQPDRSQDIFQAVSHNDERGDCSSFLAENPESAGGADNQSSCSEDLSHSECQEFDPPQIDGKLHEIVQSVLENCLKPVLKDIVNEISNLKSEVNCIKRQLNSEISEMKDHVADKFQKVVPGIEHDLKMIDDKFTRSVDKLLSDMLLIRSSVNSDFDGVNDQTQNILKLQSNLNVRLSDIENKFETSFAQKSDPPSNVPSADKDSAASNTNLKVGVGSQSPQTEMPCSAHCHENGFLIDSRSLEQVMSKVATQFRIPKPSPPVFNGDPCKYTVWCRSILSIFDLDITESEKLMYLSEHLSSDLQNEFKIYLQHPTVGSTEKILQRLDEQYGSPYWLAESYRRELENWPNIGKKDNVALRRFSNYLLQMNDIAGSSEHYNFLNSVFFLKRLYDKLPLFIADNWLEVLHEYKESHDNQYPDFSVFVEFIAKESFYLNDPIFAEVRISNHANEKQCMKTSVSDPNTNTMPKRLCKDDMKDLTKSITSNQKFASNVAKEVVKFANQSPNVSSDNRVVQNSSTQPKCYPCNQSHHIRDCPKFLSLTPPERVRTAIDNELCLLCLSSSHISQQCTETVKCRFCKRHHHSLLHHSSCIPQIKGIFAEFSELAKQKIKGDNRNLGNT